MKEKVCSKCRRKLPIEYFSVSFLCKGNRSARCKDCTKIYAAKHRRRHDDWLIEN